MTDDALSTQDRLRWQRIGTLAALALVLGYLESFVPIPIPGVKLGLANIPILVCLAGHDATGALYVALVKVVASGLLFGNPLSMAYSLVGTTLSLALMVPLSRLRTMRLEMVSVVGSLAHEAGQLLVAQALLGTPLVWYSSPVLAVAGCATGLLSGIVARKVADTLEDPSSSEREPVGDPSSIPVHTFRARAGRMAAHAGPLLIAYACLVIVILRVHEPRLLAVVTALLLCVAHVAHISHRAVRGALATCAPLVTITLVAQILAAQEGTVLLSAGPVALTREALVSALAMLFRLLDITLASLSIVELIGYAGLTRCAHCIVAPLRAWGLRTAGPELACATALQLLPLLASSIGGKTSLRDVWTTDFWIRRLPATIAWLYEAEAPFHTSQDCPS